MDSRSTNNPPAHPAAHLHQSADPQRLSDPHDPSRAIPIPQARRVRTPAGLDIPAWVANAMPQQASDHMKGLRQSASILDRRLQNPAMSAVLVLLSGDAGADTRPDDAAVVLTHRATTLRSHAGQMSFPGGRVDPEDIDVVDTALREAEEETGLNRATVTPLSVMDSIDISRTGFAVHPVLAYWHEPHPLTAVDPGETESVLHVPIAELIAPENRIMVGFAGWQGPAFRVGDFVVWGFTGGVLNYLLEITGWAAEWDREEIHDLFATLEKSANGENLITVKERWR